MRPALGAAVLGAVIAAGCGSGATRSNTTLPLLPAGCHGASTYYVDPQAGEDSNCGTSAAHPWRSIARVNGFQFSPKTMVLFAGGEHVDWREGESLSPQSGVTYASYGTGQAIFDGRQGVDAIVLCGVHDVTISNLDLEGGSDAGNTAIGLQSSERCSSSTNVTVSGDTIRNWFEGIQAGYADANWTIVHTTVEHTGGNGILFDRRDGHPNQGGEALDVIDSTILDTGERPPPYHVHGIYDNAADSQILGNTISSFQTDGVSIRFHGAVVSGNHIENGSEGIGVYEYDSVPGTSRITDNTIANTTDAGIFVCGAASGCATSLDRFVIEGNVIDGAPRDPLSLQPTAGGYQVSGNIRR